MGISQSRSVSSPETNCQAIIILGNKPACGAQIAHLPATYTTEEEPGEGGLAGERVACRIEPGGPLQATREYPAIQCVWARRMAGTS